MNDLFAAAVELDRHCRARGWSYCAIGGLAVLRWGEPRITRDVDLTVVTGFGDEEPVVSSLLAAFPARVADPAPFARETRTLLLRAANGVPLDVALGALPFEERAAGRASDHRLGVGASVRVCGAEDLVVMKAFAGRDRDWADIEGIARRQGRRLDVELVMRELEPLLAAKEAPADGARLRALVQAARG